MEKTILVTGKDTYLGDEISRFFLGQGHQVATSVTARKEPYPVVEEDSRLLVFPWNKRSPISAKNFLLQTTNRFETIDEAFLIFAPEKDSLPLAEMPVIELEEKIDAQFKGLVFLARELQALQAKNPQMGLNFVLLDEEYDDQPALTAALYHGFKGLASGILLASRRKNLPVWGFECHVPQTEDFIQFILNHPRTDAKLSLPGRWHSFGEKKNFFQSMFKSK